MAPSACLCFFKKMESLTSFGTSGLQARAIHFQLTCRCFLLFSNLLQSSQESINVRFDLCQLCFDGLQLIAFHWEEKEVGSNPNSSSLVGSQPNSSLLVCKIVIFLEQRFTVQSHAKLLQSRPIKRFGLELPCIGFHSHSLHAC